MIKYKCKLCEKEFEQYRSLCQHSGRIHKTDSVQFYVDFYLSGIWPICDTLINLNTK
jgi:hypothetical protein